MSRFDYEQSRRIARTDPSFNSLIMAAMRKADSGNVALLRQVFPAIYAELDARHHAPDAILPTDPRPQGNEPAMTHSKHIYKHQIPVGETAITLPVGAVVVSVGNEGPKTVTFWTESQDTTKTEERRFLTIPTGVEISKDLIYLGTIHDRQFVWHLYEAPKDT